MEKKALSPVSRAKNADSFRPGTPIPDICDKESNSSESDTEREQLGRALRKISISPPTPRQKKVIVMPISCWGCKGTRRVDIKILTEKGFTYSDLGTTECPDCVGRPCTPSGTRQLQQGEEHWKNHFFRQRCCCPFVPRHPCTLFTSILGAKGEQLAQCIECNGVLVGPEARM